MYWNDDSGRKEYERRVKEQFNAVPEADRLTVPYKNVESFLCESGFGELYELQMSPQKKQPTSPKGTQDYWQEVLDALPKSYSKPAIATGAVAKMTAPENALPVPKPLSDILDKVIELAEE